jgi:hypothetical protein
MNPTIISTGYQIERLTPKEIGKLKKLVIGYGNFKKISMGLDMHENTFRNIIDKGYGTPANIEQLRIRLLTN